MPYKRWSSSSTKLKNGCLFLPSEVDKARVRLAAAKGIVRISRYHHLQVVPDLTEKTSLVVQVSTLSRDVSGSSHHAVES